MIFRRPFHRNVSPIEPAPGLDGVDDYMPIDGDHAFAEATPTT
jgi:hypothetical protein